jgi:hypothetical protein
MMELFQQAFRRREPYLHINQMSVEKRCIHRQRGTSY